MLNRVKRWLGIEGVKLELIIPETVSSKTGVLEGTLRFTSMNLQTVQSITITLIERYARGRGKDKRIDEYELGTLRLDKTVEVPAQGIVEIPFSLPFQLIQSDMDQLQRRDPFTGGFVKAMKLLEGVKSDYRVEAEAVVKGVALNPFDKQPIQVK